MDVLKQLGKTVAKMEFPVDTAHFLDNLTDFINRVFVFGRCPAGVLQFLNSGELICLQQGNKTRPSLSGSQLPIARLPTSQCSSHIAIHCRLILRESNSAEQPSVQNECNTRPTSILFWKPRRSYHRPIMKMPIAMQLEQKLFQASKSTRLHYSNRFADA